MVAHLDSVTSLAVDQHGLYLISGSHDCSIRFFRGRWLLVSVSLQQHFVFKSLSRLWNLESKTCVQEITAHRKKFDESIFDVAFHPSRPYIARCALNIVVDQISSHIFCQCWRGCSRQSVHLRRLDSKTLWRHPSWHSIIDLKTSSIWQCCRKSFRNASTTATSVMLCNSWN